MDGQSTDPRTTSVPVGTPCPPSLLNRIGWFRERFDEYHSPSFNEASLRSNFLRAFFHDGLNWDIEDDKGQREADREVLVEESVNVKGVTQRLDYVFRVGGVTKFIVEAKKPSIDILNVPEPALQLRNYGWNSKLSLCVLTNFEAFAVYDVRIPPRRDDVPRVARVRFYTFEEYASKWHEIWGVFSRDAVLSGALDGEAAKQPATGREEVDDSFLREIEAWREDLAKNLKLRNPSLTSPELNFAVQAIIDRIIFLRMGEDRRIEPPRRLLSCASGPGIFARLNELFLQADQRYDSGLFHFQNEKGRASGADLLTPSLRIDDQVLKRIISSLYPPISPYDFRILPVEVLGQAYERFLGKAIEVTEKRARIELKPELRKSGGIYYTPSFIVDKIVRETLEPLVAGKTPEQVALLRVVDPACGSGSFLLGAYQYLLNWHLEQYSKLPRKWKGRITEVGTSTYALTTEERRRILVANVYGMDIDAQAVEVTKLSLLLRVLEKTPGELIDRQLRLSRERALPDLDNNIRCGNSLLDFRQVGGLLVDDGTRHLLNPANWHDEFPNVFTDGGFDAVIGNPPYVPVQTLKEGSPLQADLLQRNYNSAKTGNFDIYACFIERAIHPMVAAPLLRPTGRLGFIVPHKFLNSKYGAPLRTLLSEGRHVAGIVHFGDQQVFEGATTYTCLLSLTESPSAEFSFQRVDDLIKWRLTGDGVSAVLPFQKLGPTEWTITLGRASALRERLEAIRPLLGSISDPFVGLQTSDDPVYVFEGAKLGTGPTTSVVSKLSNKRFELESELLKPVIRRVGGIDRYWGNPNALVLFPYRKVAGHHELLPEAVLKDKYPRAWEYLTEHKVRLANREHRKWAEKGWYRIYPKNLDAWEQPKVMLPYMIRRLTAYYDRSNSYFVNVTTGGFGLTVKDPGISLKYLTGLLNSRLLDWYLKQVSTNFQGGYFAANKQYIDKLPIRVIGDESNVASFRDEIERLVDTEQALHTALHATRIDAERVRLNRQIAAGDDRINQLVYQIYSVSQEEKEIVEAVVPGSQDSRKRRGPPAGVTA